MNLPRGASRRS